MNGIDIALVVLLLGAAVRGFWRGFFREVFGFAALLVGLWAALQSTAAGAALLGRYVGLPAATLAAVAFLAVFMIVHTGGNLMGIALSRLAGPRGFFGIGRVAGALFAASKAGIVGFTRAVAVELASRAITVNAVAPGFIDTDMTRALPESVREELLGRVPLGRLGQAEEVAALVSFLLSEEAAYITGQVIHVNGGLC